MTTEQKKSIMIDRMNKLQNNKKNNMRIVQKLQRKLKSM